jgi:HPt (histidine-containing phosphotransfer) domain-containing protein
LLERWGTGRPGVPQSQAQSLFLALDEKRVSALLSMSARKNPDVFGQLIDLYLEDFRTLLQAMKVSAGTADSADLARAAHRLKGASLNLGVSGIADICQRIEEIQAKKEPMDLAPLLQTLEQSYGLVQKALEEVKRSAQKGVR